MRQENEPLCILHRALHKPAAYMSTSPLKPRQALNKAYRKVKPNRSDMERFKSQLVTLLDRTNETESEEFHKNLVSDFLKKSFYDPGHFINTKGRNDLVIHNGAQAASSVGVIIEAKKPTNKSEMMTKDKLNTKALQELVLYYLRERITLQNLEIKHLVVTNIHEWFVFDAAVFDRLFAQNKGLVRQFTDFEAGRLADTRTDFFYRDIAEPFIRNLTGDIPFTWFDLRTYEKPLRNADKADDHALIALFKVLSPEHLLKLPFANDSNSLDKRFYSELLHIIGLTETKEKGKKLIGRNPPGERHPGTLLEEAIVQLDNLDKLSRLDRPSQFGANKEERLFNVALELSITWINRILFLKLLEAQLIAYHKGDPAYAFLQSAKIDSYDALNGLFFQVLAKRHTERNDDVQAAFRQVPYLNSSLFEPTEMEHNTLFISNLRDDKRIPIFAQTVLKDEQGKRRSGSLNTLQYLFAFLDAYDFGAEGSEDIQEDNKTLINASVLGLIFEKINGYKDGSFFTPGFITMYMCRETIRRAVVQKFNEVKGWTCDTLDQLYDHIGKRSEDRNEANAIINSLKICDPAVGSGHFLVSALNELIAVKYDLRILQDRAGRRLKEYQIEVVNDELIITDEDGALFEYHPQNKESQRVQETLFHEKQALIENCLFGVDINPNSVKICRLRLWIELLKHAYYKNATELETLPNIDINIKCGNSLVSRFALDADLKQALRQSKWNMSSYRLAVSTYRNASTKEQKRDMERLIDSIKSDFRSEIHRNDPKVARLRRLNGELFNLTNQGQLFEMGAREKAAWQKKLHKLTAEAEKLEAEIEAIKANKIYENAFEWRFEFPEVLDDEGDFVGFDVVIGNPPYIRQEELKEFKPFFQQRFETFAGTADLYVFFVEQGMDVLKPHGKFCYIFPNKWMRASYGDKLRQYVKRFSLESIVDFGDLPVFEEATTYPIVMHMRKAAAQPTVAVALPDNLHFNGLDLKAYLEDRWTAVQIDRLQDSGWTLASGEIQALLDKLRQTGVPLGEYVNGRIYYGVKTGLNEAFVIDRATRDRLIAEDARSAEVIKPFLAGKDIKRWRVNFRETYVLFTRRGIEIEQYPAILSYLSQYREQLEPRPKDWTGSWKGRKPGTYKWYEIQDSVDYYEAFSEPKIMLPDISQQPNFCLDERGDYFFANTGYMIISGDKTLLGILNSRLMDFFYRNAFAVYRGGYLRFFSQYMVELPIFIPADASNAFVSRIEALVAEILTRKGQEPQADTRAQEAEIDRLVYALYGLTEEEIAVVEG